MLKSINPETTMNSSNAGAKPDITTLLADLNGGVFLEQVEAAVREAALGVAITGKKGHVTIKLNLTRIGESNQVECKHTLSFDRPTAKGRRTEESSTSTPLYVSGKGELSLFPIQHQEPLFKGQGAGERTDG